MGKIKNVETYTEEFTSLRAFIQTIQARPVNAACPTRSSQKVSNEGGFRTCKTFDEAVELCLHGDDKSYGLIKNEIFSHGAQTKEYEMDMRPRFELAAAGFFPNVPAYLAGRPRCMVTRKKSPAPAKIVNVITNGGISSAISAKNAAQTNAMFFSAIQFLERNGLRVNVFYTDKTVEKYRGKEAKELGAYKQEIITIIKIKDASQPLNGPLLAFPLINPDMQRRMLFAHQETLPIKMHWKFYGGYGYASPIAIKELPTHLQGDNTCCINIAEHCASDGTKILGELTGKFFK